MRDVVLPKGRPPADTHAYTLEEIARMLEVLSEPAATIVAIAAFTGIRKGELRGLLWENYSGSEVRITQSVWGGQVQAPKTKASRAPVPVIPRLAERLFRHRAAQGNPGCGLIFPNTIGRPMNLDRLAWAVVRPALCKAGIEWHGWHAFRRGLASNLYRLGVVDKVIQAILRHANVAVTQRWSVADTDKAHKPGQTSEDVNQAAARIVREATER